MEFQPAQRVDRPSKLYPARLVLRGEQVRTLVLFASKILSENSATFLIDEEDHMFQALNKIAVDNSWTALGDLPEDEDLVDSVEDDDQDLHPEF